MTTCGTSVKTVVEDEYDKSDHGTGSEERSDRSRTGGVGRGTDVSLNNCGEQNYKSLCVGIQ